MGGSSHKELKISMKKIQEKNMVPFLSPMLEDDPGKKFSLQVHEAIHNRNYQIIQDCIQLVSEELPSNQRSLAIKLTAFMPISFLVRISSPYPKKFPLLLNPNYKRSKAMEGYGFERRTLCDCRKLSVTNLNCTT